MHLHMAALWVGSPSADSAALAVEHRLGCKFVISAVDRGWKHTIIAYMECLDVLPFVFLDPAIIDLVKPDCTQPRG